MHTILVAIVAFVAATGCFHQLPAVYSQVITARRSEACLAADVIDQVHADMKTEVQSILHDTVVPELIGRYSNQPQCPCGGLGDWTRIAYLNMTDLTQQCPPNWRLITTPVRGCASSSNALAGCDSATFSSNGLSYSRVCGRINAYQRGSTDAFAAFIAFNTSLEREYIDGVSLTHGPAGSRQHIWSFAAALWENDNSYGSFSNSVCSCTNSNFTWPHQVPSYVGSNYFCATANPGPGFSGGSTIYTDDPLWDGEGCGPANTCCEFNHPPWFCTTLPQPTTDDMEVRVCHDFNDRADFDENNIISLIDIYAM